jgi:hypothetical protein
MLRAASYTLLVASLLTASLHAQRGSGGFRGPAGFSAYAGQRGSFNGAFSGRRGGFYPYFSPDLSDDESYWFQGPQPEPLQRILYSPPEPERTPTAPQVIEIPHTQIPHTLGTTEAEPQPPAMFVLKSGERLEGRRFLLTATTLSININRSQRVIPLDALDLDATVAGNRQRGITLQIPADRNEICLSF